MFDPGLLSKPITSLILGKTIEKLVLNADIVIMQGEEHIVSISHAMTNEL